MRALRRAPTITSSAVRRQRTAAGSRRCCVAAGRAGCATEWYLSAVDLTAAEIARLTGAKRPLPRSRTLASAGQSGRPVSREEILSRVWGLDPVGITTRTIDMHVARLREKLRDDPAAPQVLVTVRGKGYAFAGEVREVGP